MGNAVNVVRALAQTGANVVLLSTLPPVGFLGGHALVVPGQGTTLSMRGGVEYLAREHIASGGKYLGICLGMQMLYEGSEEGGTGLGVLPGVVRRLPRARIGWEETLHGHVYFCHGYSAGADYVQHDGVTGVQWHPEKSGADGLRFLAEWAKR